MLFFVLYLFVSFSRKPGYIMKIIAIFVLIIKCIELVIRHEVNEESWYNLLPLHLCNITLSFAILGAFFRFKPFLYLTFFWSIGALFAIITPEVKVVFPNFLNISFFITHIFIIFTAIVEYRVFKLRPSFESWLGSFIALNLVMVAVYFINSSLHTNYLYISQKPTFDSPLVYLGEWPYYIISVEIIYIILTLILLAIFRKKESKLIILR